jgi:hypothetical protein
MKLWLHFSCWQCVENSSWLYLLTMGREFQVTLLVDNVWRIPAAFFVDKEENSNWLYLLTMGRNPDAFFVDNGENSSWLFLLTMCGEFQLTFLVNNVWRIPADIAPTNLIIPVNLCCAFGIINSLTAM